MNAIAGCTYFGEICELVRRAAQRAVPIPLESTTVHYRVCVVAASP